MRTVLHSDLNNFYASVECAMNPELRQYPIAVCGDPEARHGIVLAKSEAAKRCGVKTGEPIWQARQKCGNLKVVPPHFSEYIRFSQAVREIYLDYTDQVEPFGLDEAWLDVTGSRILGDGTEIAHALRERVKRELDVTVSVGVSFNKVFAKLGSDMKKPDAVTEITAENFRRKVWPLPVSDLLYVGPATTRKLARRNVFTIGQLANTPPEVLRSAMGKVGLMIWQYANGLESSPVAVYGSSVPVKSVGNSTTTPRDLLNDEDARITLYLLSESVAERLREQGLKAQEVSVSVRSNDLTTVGFQTRLSHRSNLSGEIADCAWRLFHERYLWPRPIRSMGVCAGDLSLVTEPEQLAFFDDPEQARKEALEAAVVGLRQRFGRRCVCRGMQLLDRELSAVDPKGVPIVLP
ncbi:MAG: DNA polymerase IV, partial [Clostridia bacterium]|nr:DNA polymerase IV [Clostridia bacterium]